MDPLEALLEAVRLGTRSWPIAAPVEGTTVAAVATSSGAAGDHLVLTFGTPGVTPEHLVSGSVVDPLEVGAPPAERHRVAVRPSFWTGLSTRLYFHGQSFDYLEYVVSPGVDLAGGLAVLGADREHTAGSPFPVSTSSLAVGFLHMEGGVRRYRDPAVVLRMLAFLAPQLRSLVTDLMLADGGSAPLGLDRFLAYHDQARLLQTPESSFAFQLLYHEYDHLLTASFPLSPALETAYTSRLPGFVFPATPPPPAAPPTLSSRMSYADLLGALTGGSTLAAAIGAADPPYRVCHVFDRHMWLVFATLTETWVDIFPIGSGRQFATLWPSHRQELLEAGYFAVFSGVFEKLNRTPSRLKFRGSTSAIDNDSPAVRFWYGQRPDGELVFGRGRLPLDLPIASGCDNLLGFMVGGALISPTDDLDVASIRADPKSMGLPLFGRAVQDGTKYAFWLGRDDVLPLTEGIPGAELASVDEMLALLAAIGATDIMGTDASDSIGFIDLFRGESITPHPTKDAFMRTALGFRRRAP